jgi:hypothetical protein
MLNCVLNKKPIAITCVIFVKKITFIWSPFDWIEQVKIRLLFLLKNLKAKLNIPILNLFSFAFLSEIQRRYESLVGAVWNFKSNWNFIDFFFIDSKNFQEFVKNVVSD